MLLRQIHLQMTEMIEKENTFIEKAAEPVMMEVQQKNSHQTQKHRPNGQELFEEAERLDCEDEWAKHAHADLNDVYTYLYNHGYDSPQPATCQ